MHDRDTLEVESYLVATRAAISRSRAHIAHLRSDLAETQAFVDAIWRDLIVMWHKLAEIEHHGSQPRPDAER